MDCWRESAFSCATAGRAGGLASAGVARRCALPDVSKQDSVLGQRRAHSSSERDKGANEIRGGARRGGARSVGRESMRRGGASGRTRSKGSGCTPANERQGRKGDCQGEGRALQRAGRRGCGAGRKRVRLLRKKEGGAMRCVCCRKPGVHGNKNSRGGIASRQGHRLTAQTANSPLAAQRRPQAGAWLAACKALRAKSTAAKLTAATQGKRCSSCRKKERLIKSS